MQFRLKQAPFLRWSQGQWGPLAETRAGSDRGCRCPHSLHPTCDHSSCSLLKESETLSVSGMESFIEKQARVLEVQPLDAPWKILKRPLRAVWTVACRVCNQPKASTAVIQVVTAGSPMCPLACDRWCLSGARVQKGTVPRAEWIRRTRGISRSVSPEKIRSMLLLIVVRFSQLLLMYTGIICGLLPSFRSCLLWCLWCHFLVFLSLLWSLLLSLLSAPQPSRASFCPYSVHLSCELLC